ncbi:hypothetical protein BKA56DRAFT_680733 [Ilyonectria sp. MPI-CAGE-AT-0026]|nr:hypothetical protein BKA56DRAFT_680733 [Ilyonectria sp. MPI-CAGE-AT-0026]
MLLTHSFAGPFPLVKKSLVKPEHKQKVIESYDGLMQILKSEVDLIEQIVPSIMPKIDFEDVRNNGKAHIPGSILLCINDNSSQGDKLPSAFADPVHERGCVILRNVMPEEQAAQWETALKGVLAGLQSEAASAASSLKSFYVSPASAASRGIATSIET